MAIQLDDPPAPTPAAAGSGPTRSPMVILAIVLTATFMQLVDISIVNVAIPSIQRELHASYAAVQLVLAGYQLAFACTLITAARLGDIYGRRRLFVIGMVGFTVASALCGAAPTANVLIAARVLQGLFSGLMFPQVLSVIQVTFPPRERGRAFSVYGAVIGLATITGPLLGGALIQLNIAGLDWRSIFYVNVPIGVGAVVAARRALGESKAPAATKLDVPGALLVTVGLFLLVFPLTEGREKGWPVWIYAMLAAAVPVLAVFVAYELRRTRADRFPLLRMSLFSDRAFRAGLVLCLVFFAGIAPFFFTFSVYLQIGFGYSALGSGLTSFPFAVASGLASSQSDRIAKRLGNAVLSIGALTLVVGMSLLVLVVHLAGTQVHSWQLWPVLLISGVGLGLFIAPVTTIILDSISKEGAGSASGVLSTVQQIGGALGIALIGVLFFGLLGHNSSRASAAVTPDLRRTVQAAGLPGPATDAVLRGFTRCFDDRSRSSDPSAEPASCRAARDQTGSGAVPPEVRQRVAQAVAQAAPLALKHNFSRSFEQALGYEVGVFSLAYLLVLALPSREHRAGGSLG